MNDEPQTILSCGLVMPISGSTEYTEQHWQDVALIIKEALAGTNFSVELVSNSDEVGVIQKRIVQNLYGCDLVICDVSAKNPNVMFELGMRLAFDKPAIVIKDSITSYSFDTAPIEHLVYPRDLRYHTIQAFKQKLREKALATYEASLQPEYTTFLKHFGEFVVTKIEARTVSKEDFILEELGELRSAVVEMARTNATRSNKEWFIPRKELPKKISEKEYVHATIGLETKNLPELRRLDSQDFSNFVKRYMFEAGIQEDELTVKDSEQIKRNLLGALNAVS